MAFALTGRAAKRLIAVGVALIVLFAAFLWALPEVVRRVATDQASKTLGRPVSIDDVDLNLFTRRLAVKKFRLAEAKGPEAFVAFERLDVRFSYWPLFRSDVRIPEIALDGLAVRVVRTGPAEFNFSDIVEKFSQPGPEKPPSKWTVTVDRLDVTRALIQAADQHVTPSSEWRLDGLGIQGAGLTTRPNQLAGSLKVSARLNESPLALEATSIQLAPPLTASARVSLSDFDLVRIGPYVPPDLPASLKSGKLAVDLTVSIEKAPDALRKASASGEVRLDALSVLERDQSDPFLSVGRLALGLKEADLVARAATVAIDVDGLEVKAARNKAGEIAPLAAFAKARAEAPAAGGAPAPTTETGAAKPEPTQPAGPPFRVTVERLALRSGAVSLTDDAVAPPIKWKIDDLTVDGSGLSTAADAPPGRLAGRARIASIPARGKPANLKIEADSLRITPLAASVKVSLSGFDVTSAMPYLPDTLPASPSKGTLGVDLAAQVEHGEAGLSRALVSGSVKLDDTAIVQRGAPKPFLALPRIAVVIKEADAIAHAVALSRIELEGLDVRAVRDAKGQIDLLGLVASAPAEGGAPAPPPSPKNVRAPPPPPGARADGDSAPPVAAPAPSPPMPAEAKAAPAPGAWRLGLDRFVLTKGTATFDDQAVSPATTLVLGDIAIAAEQLSWPPTKKAALTLSVSMPGGGKTEIKGGGTLEPLNIQIRTVTQDAPIEPYQPYFPFVARMFGLFSGDSLNEIQRGPDGALILASRGNAWARKLELRGPDSEEPVSRTEELEIQKIDFSWPNYALVDLVRIKHPEIQVERSANGEINLRKLFEPKKKPSAEGGSEDKPAEEKPAEAPPGTDPASSPDAKSGPAGTVLDFNEIRIEDGFLRFLDRTTKPAFSQDVSKVVLSVRNLSNVLGRQRTTMSLQALVGGDAALDMRGEMSGLDEAFHADLVGELRNFALASANPYADSLTSWIVQRGKLTTKVHYRIDGDRLSAEHDVKFAGLNVQRAHESDEAKQKLGLPLGLVVALLKDRQGDIDFDVPLHGTLSDKTFDWGEAMWAGIKQVLLKVLAAPFNAIGRMFTGGGDKVEELAINPVTFEPGSSVIAPSAELQITRVADFLRRSPYVKVDLTAVATKADAQSMRSHEVLARIQQFQKEKGLAELAEALKAYYAQNLPGVALPETVDAQLAQLAERQAVLPSALEDLTSRRLDGVKDRLVQAEGIPAERVSPGKAPASDKEADGEGRVEFAIAAE